jgi:phage gp29-like protein
MEHNVSLFRQGALESVKVSRNTPSANFGELRSTFSGMSQELIKIENPRNIWGLYTDEFTDLNPDRIKFYLEAARLGVNWWKSSLFEEIRRKDLRIGAICQTRKYSVAKKQWELAYPDEIADEKSTEQKEIIAFYNENFKRIKPAGLIANMTEAQIQGVSTFEINYEIYNSKVGLKSIKYKPNHILLYDDIEDMYMYLDPAKNDLLILNPLSANIIQDRYDVKQIAIPNIHPLKILEVHALDGNAQNGFQNGCIDSLIWCYYLKNYGLKDFGMYIERLGIPALIAKYDPLMNADERSVLYTAIKNWGRLYKLMVPNTAEIDLLTDQTKSQTGNLFGEYIDFWNTEATIRVLGQNLTTAISDQGSRAAAEVHDTVREDLVEADMTVVTEGMNEIVERLGMINFPGKQLPVWRFKERANVEYQVKRASIYAHIKNAGYRVTKETIESEMELQVEEYSEPVNTPSAAGDKSNEDKNITDKNTDEKKIKEKTEGSEEFSIKFTGEASKKETEDFLEKIFIKSKPSE